MKLLIEIIVEFISFHLQQIEVRIKIQTTMLWLQYEQIKMEMLTKLAITQVAKSLYDFLINRYGHDAVSHTLIMIIELLSEMGETMLHHIQTMSTLPWRRYAFRWAPTSRMWMLC